MKQFVVQDVEEIISRIEHLLVDHKWTKNELSRQTGINGGTLRTMLGTRSKYPPRSDYMYQIASALGVTVEYLMTGKEPEGKEEVKLSPVKQRYMDFVTNTPDEKLERLIELMEHVRAMERD